MKTLAGLVLAVVGIGALLFGYATHDTGQPVPPDSINVGVALPSGTAHFETSLQDRISSTDSSMSIVSASVRGGGTLSGYQCFTVDEGRSDAEFICGTLSGTTVSTLERGIDPLTGTSTVATLKFAYRKGANIKITDFPFILRVRNQANGAEGFQGDVKGTHTLFLFLALLRPPARPGPQQLPGAPLKTANEGLCPARQSPLHRPTQYLQLFRPIPFGEPF
jgi:hypothetical protein